MSLLLLAASEPSRVPFYICGGAFALWAVILAGIGITQPEFPRGNAGARGVMAISFLMLVLAIGAAVLTDP